MALSKKNGFKRFGLFSAPLIVMAVGAGSLQGCDSAAEDICGKCGNIENGDVGITGNAKFDGFFKSVAILNEASATASAEFELGLSNLEAAFGITAEGDLQARVDALTAEISAEIEANASGGLVVNVAPAKCTADVNLAVSAQASCEASAECDVSAECEGGEVSVTCEGSCTGSCEGGCEGTATCKVDAGGVACEGKCEGTCELSAAAACEGTCKGSCSGECSAYDGQGNCAGSCDGQCEGSCEVSAGAECNGSCTGSCTAEAPEAECQGEVKCEGSCQGECSGGCEGKATPPSCSAEGSCEASAECEAQASAQASANVQCTPPSIEVGFTFTGNASAQAAFDAKIGALKANAGLMVGSFAKYSALFDGKVNGEVVFDPAPVAQVSAGLEGIISGGADVFADLPSGRIPCALPAFESSVTILGELTTEATATISAQASFVTALSGGFSS